MSHKIFSSYSTVIAKTLDTSDEFKVQVTIFKKWA